LTPIEQNRNIGVITIKQAPPMSQGSTPNPPPDEDHVDAVADEAIAVCGGDVRKALKAMIVAYEELEAEVKRLHAALSNDSGRGFFQQVPADRKDWHDGWSRGAPSAIANEDPAAEVKYLRAAAISGCAREFVEHVPPDRRDRYD
jgi:hypothetical protein